MRRRLRQNGSYSHIASIFAESDSETGDNNAYLRERQVVVEYNEFMQFTHAQL